MIDDENQAGDEFAVQDDFDAGDDLDGGAGEKPTLKDAWQSNPLLKIGAAVLVAALAVVAYTTITKPNPIEETKSVVVGGDIDDVKATIGKGQHDKKYTEAVEKKNVQRAKEAQATGGSSLPTPVATAQDQGLPIPQQSKTVVDPLKEWRDSVQARKINSQEKQTIEEDMVRPPPKAELVPLVQPITPRPETKIDPKATQGLAAQMRAVLNKQRPRKPRTVSVTRQDNEYTKQKKEKDLLERQMKEAAKAAATGGPVPAGQQAYVAGGASAAGSVNQQASPQTIIPAGDIFYAQLLMDLNSDIPIPVLATVLSGPFAGGRAIGSMAKQDDYLVLTFSRIIKDDVNYSINGIALDEATALPALQTDIDNHYFDRLVLPIASQFVSGYAGALAETGTQTTTTSGGGVVSSQDKPDARESLYKGLQKATDTVSQIIMEDAKTEPTVYVARGTTMGVLVLDTITTANASQ